MYFTIKIILKNNYIIFKRGVNINEYMKTLKKIVANHRSNNRAEDVI
jgi:hypothetical protein